MDGSGTFLGIETPVDDPVSDAQLVARGADDDRLMPARETPIGNNIVDDGQDEDAEIAVSPATNSAPDNAPTAAPPTAAHATAAHATTPATGPSSGHATDCEIVQNDHGIRLEIDHSRTQKLTRFGLETLEDRYLLPGESVQGLFARVALSYADDSGHAQRLYDYMSNLWFMPATPILSNGGTDRGLPISCFLNEASDSLGGILGLWNENVWLAARGGGIGSYWGNLRSIGEKVGLNGKTSGVVPFIRVMDSLTLAISQGSLRRGSAAVYLPIDHPEIEEFIELRKPTGGDPNRKAPNLHHGILISDAFMRAVEADADWPLLSPKDKTVVRVVGARDLWIRLLTSRVETGEPYIVYSDTVNRAIPEHHKLAGLGVRRPIYAVRSPCRPAPIIWATIAPPCAASARSISKHSWNGATTRNSLRT